jgi:hypothetical protein
MHAQVPSVCSIECGIVYRSFFTECSSWIEHIMDDEYPLYEALNDQARSLPQRGRRAMRFCPCGVLTARRLFCDAVQRARGARAAECHARRHVYGPCCQLRRVRRTGTNRGFRYAPTRLLQPPASVGASVRSVRTGTDHASAPATDSQAPLGCGMVALSSRRTANWRRTLAPPDTRILVSGTTLAAKVSSGRSYTRSSTLLCHHWW